MGFCYFNSVAVASLEAVALGCRRVAVYDFDVHHGNGTEDILLDHPNCAYYSIHQFPFYPGSGARSFQNIHNCPVPARTPREEYRKALGQALADLKEWRPDLLAISAGFDAYRKDPLGEETFEIEDYHWLGQAIRNLKVPHFSILEGGYSDDLPDLILAFLKGMSGI